MLSGDGDNGVVADSGVPVIGSPYLAEVIGVIEEQVEILSRIQTVGCPSSDRRALVVRCEKIGRALFGMSHTWIADLVAQRGLDVLPGSTPHALSGLLRCSSARAGQRLRLAEQFGERTTLTGERLDPACPATAAAAEDGVLDEQHQKIVREFFRALPSSVDVETRGEADKQLAQLARELGPDQFRVAAARLFDLLDTDGDLDDDEERIAQRCFVRFGRQGRDGLSKGSFVVDAELRAYLEAAFGKWAKPGMCNPADPRPATDDPDSPDPDDPDTSSDSGADSSDSGDGRPDPSLFDSPDSPDSPSDSGGSVGSGGSAGEGSGSGGGAGSDPEARARRDVRSQGRRQHDALKVILRQMLASGQLGQHRGLPVTAVVTMTLEQLESATGHAVTATGSLVQMRDAIRMAAHAHHYLVIFGGDGRPLYLGRSKRLATADQRIVLTASDRGCTFPGCTRPAAQSQVHHIDEWRTGGRTDIDTLTFGCDMHHRLVGPTDTDWATTTTTASPDDPYPGRTRWHPPATVDPSRTGRVNHFHHPNEYIYPTPAGDGTIPNPTTPNPSTPTTSTPTPGAPEPGAPPAA